MSDLVSKEFKPKVRLQIGAGYRFVNGVVNDYKLNTVCEEANCPNIYESLVWFSPIWMHHNHF